MTICEVSWNEYFINLLQGTITTLNLSTTSVCNIRVFRYDKHWRVTLEANVKMRVYLHAVQRYEIAVRL